MTRNLLKLIARSFLLATITTTYAFAQGTAATCPVQKFDEVILFIAQGKVNNINEIALPDPTHSYLKNVMGFDDAQIAQTAHDAEVFFRDRFGFDFTNLAADAFGNKTIPGVAILTPSFANPSINYRAVYATGIGDLPGCPRVKDFGYVVTVLGQNVRYHGSYGGEAGLPSQPGESLLYGYYRLEGMKMDRFPYTRTLMIRFEAGGPAQLTPNGQVVIDCIVFHPDYGRGEARGSSTLIPNADGTFNVAIRNVLTFPGK
jgi:hypothetical protein